ncbi:UNVERIFIED_CONTAM: hypothetical protein FKN15_058853 [Acipenser sinensis]
MLACVSGGLSGLFPVFTVRCCGEPGVLLLGGEVIFTPPTDRVGLLPKSLPSLAVPRWLEGTPGHNYPVAAHALASPRPQPCYPIYLVSFQVRAPFCPFWLAESPPAEPGPATRGRGVLYFRLSNADPRLFILTLHATQLPATLPGDAALSSDGSIPLSFMSLIESVFYVCLLILLVRPTAKRRHLVLTWTESFVLICSGVLYFRLSNADPRLFILTLHATQLPATLPGDAALSSDGSIPLSFMSLIESVFYVCHLILLVRPTAKRRRLVPTRTESFVLICSISLPEDAA